MGAISKLILGMSGSGPGLAWLAGVEVLGPKSSAEVWSTSEVAGGTGDAEDGFRFECLVWVFGEIEVGEEEPEFLDEAGPAIGIGEKETLLFDAFDPERDRFLMLDRNRDVVPSFFSGLLPVNDPRAEDGPIEAELGAWSGVAFPEALFALAWSLNFFWWSSWSIIDRRMASSIIT
jgi:hypothetical protein